jgi:choline dehydrogenase-like flavoprotein
MEIDLQNASAHAEPIRSHVCIVGGGIAGLVLAHDLCRRGIHVVLLEAGDHSVRGVSEPDVQIAGHPHEGLAEGRSRVFGGTSLRWGGQLLPLFNDPAWPVDSAALAPFVTQAESLLGVDHLSYEADRFFPEAGLAAPALLSGLMELDGRLSKWTPFARRNLASTIGHALLRHPCANIYLNAQATELLSCSDGRRIEAIRVAAPSGRILRFEAAHFVLAAGTVDTVRLLLASRNVSARGVGNTHDQVGRNFHDHLTVPAAEVTGPARDRLLSDLRPWVVASKGSGATLHSAKLVATQQLCAQLDINPVLAHLTLEEPEDAGVSVIRMLLRGLQSEGLSRALRRHAARLPGAATEAARLAWEARVQHRRYVSQQARVKLYLNTAQDAPSTSRITLGSEVDAHGVPLPCVDWRISPREVLTLRRFATWLDERSAAQGVQGIAWDKALLIADDSVDSLKTLDDARHAMGGACMGTDPQTSVVDANMAVHGVDNLSIASAATFPTGAAHLPTLPLMALTLRLAERLAGEPTPLL